MTLTTPRWDLFCTVIDNFGDAGVCWRLARALVKEHGIAVRLLIDAPAVLARLEPRLSADLERQTVEGVEVLRWNAHTDFGCPAGVVIEGFGTALPDTYLHAMAALPSAPVWLNLEYLSAEDWVAGCHALPSPHPQLALQKWFFFPGFGAGTGGLLREADLFARRDAAQATTRPGEALAISLFAYENAALPALLEAWANGPRPIHCQVPAGRVQATITSWLGQALAESSVERGALRLTPLPFVAQPDYDPLLWACDLNFVRGEDSFVRAQWAAKPLVWQAYPQEQAAHLDKLEAFLQRYTEGLEPVPSLALTRFHHAWNDPHAHPDAAAQAWPALARALPALREHAARWSADLAAGPELAASLVKFVQLKLKY